MNNKISNPSINQAIIEIPKSKNLNKSIIAIAIIGSLLITGGIIQVMNISPVIISQAGSYAIVGVGSICLFYSIYRVIQHIRISKVISKLTPTTISVSTVVKTPTSQLSTKLSNTSTSSAGLATDLTTASASVFASPKRPSISTTTPAPAKIQSPMITRAPAKLPSIFIARDWSNLTSADLAPPKGPSISTITPAPAKVQSPMFTQAPMELSSIFTSREWANLILADIVSLKRSSMSTITQAPAIATIQASPKRIPYSPTPPPSTILVSSSKYSESDLREMTIGRLMAIEEGYRKAGNPHFESERRHIIEKISNLAPTNHDPIVVTTENLQTIPLVDLRKISYEDRIALIKEYSYISEMRPIENHEYLSKEITDSISGFYCDKAVLSSERLQKQYIENLIPNLNQRIIMNIPQSQQEALIDCLNSFSNEIENFLKK